MITFEPIRRALAERLPAGRPAERAAERRASARRSLHRAGALGAAIALVPLAGYLGTAVLMAIMIGTAEAAPFSLSAALAAALPGWLALHQVPLSISASPLSAFPLVPTGLIVLLIAVASSRAADRAELTRPDQARWIVLSMALAHGLIGLGIALLLPAVVAADPVRAFLYCGLTALMAATLGVAGRCGLIPLVRAQAGAEICAGARIGASAVVGAAAIGTLLVLLSLLWSLPEIGEILTAAGSPGDAFGLTLLSLLYLPNAVLAAWSFAAGSGLSIGAVELSPFGTTPGDLPAVPLFAVLPSGSGAWWWVLVLPPLLGVRVGRSCLRVPVSRRRAWWVFAVAVGVAAPGVGLLAGLGGGRLGGAQFDPVTLEPGLLTATTFGWIAVPAAVVLWLLRRTGERVGTQVATGGTADSTGARSDPATLEAEEVAVVAASEDAPGSSDVEVVDPRGHVAAEAPGEAGEDGEGSEDGEDGEAGEAGEGGESGEAGEEVPSGAPAGSSAGGGTDKGDDENADDAAEASGRADVQGEDARDGPDSLRPR